MELKKLAHDFTVCKLASEEELSKELPYNSDFYFIGKTDEEISLVCMTEDVPIHTVQRDDGWKAFRIQGILDFSLIGILSKITGILAENEIGIFAVSTFHTDYILVKKESFDKALQVLDKAGYTIV